MISSTKSFNRLKREQQDAINFSILLCHAIPTVKKMISGKTQNVKFFEIPKADYFPNSSDERILAISKQYKHDMSKYLVLSTFSFFESYIKSLVNEFLDFHGGKDELINKLNQNRQALLRDNDVNRKHQYLKKISEYYKPKNKMQYSKYSELAVQELKYNMPSRLLSTYAIKHISESVNGDGFRAHGIPELLEVGFGMDLSRKINKHTELENKSLKETFFYMKDIRNKISHGDNPKIGFEKSMDLVRFLRKFAVDIDKYFLNYFFVIEN